VGTLTVAPATIDLAAAEAQLLNEIGRDRLLADARLSRTLCASKGRTVEKRGVAHALFGRPQG